MSKPVLFVSGLGNNFERAENIYSLYEAYQGEKECMCTRSWNFVPKTHSGKYSMMVIDVFPKEHPLKTALLWHAIDGGKYVGLDEGKYYDIKQADYMDYMFVAGTGAVDIASRYTGVPKDRILPVGMPRTDRYIGKKKGDGATVFADKRMYLYVPTFRHGDETPLPDINWKYIDSMLTDNEVLVIKSHPYSSGLNIGNYKHIVKVPSMAPSVNYLYDCDVVITDYSSIMFDAYLLKKPVVLFEKNPGYLETRGMYLKYPDEYSSKYATNEEELVQIIRSAKRMGKAEKDCINKVANWCDGKACLRISEIIERIIREDERSKINDF